MCIKPERSLAFPPSFIQNIGNRMDPTHPRPFDTLSGISFGCETPHNQNLRSDRARLWWVLSRRARSWDEEYEILKGHNRQISAEQFNIFNIILGYSWYSRHVEFHTNRIRRSVTTRRLYMTPFRPTVRWAAFQATMASAWDGEGIWNLCWWMSLFRLGHQVCSMRSQNQRNTCHKRHVVASVSSVSSVSSANKKSDGWKGTVLVSMSLWLWLLVARRADVLCRTRRAKRCARWSYCDQGRGGAPALMETTSRRASCRYSL